MNVVHVMQKEEAIQSLADEWIFVKFAVEIFNQRIFRNIEVVHTNHLRKESIT